MGSLAQTLTSLPHTELIDLASGFSIEKDAFVHAWHARFHDNKAFIRGTFDIFDVSKDGVVSAGEIEGLVNLALLHGGNLNLYLCVIQCTSCQPYPGLLTEVICICVLYNVSPVSFTRLLTR